MIDAFHIYLTGTHAIVLRQSGFGRRKKIESVGEFEWNATDASTLSVALPPPSAKWLKNWSTVSFYIGSGCCKFMLVDLPPEIEDEHELRAIAAAQMQYQLGLTVSDWRFTLDINQPTGKSIACAIRGDLMVQIEQLVARKKCRLVSCQAYISSIWNAFNVQCKDEHPYALFALENDAVTVVTAQGNNINSINSYLHANNPTLIERELKRLSATLSTDTGQHIYIIQSGKLAENVFSQVGVGVKSMTSMPQQLRADFSDLMFLPIADSAE